MNLIDIFIIVYFTCTMVYRTDERTMTLQVLPVTEYEFAQFDVCTYV